jgi:hypothetical protein
VSELRDRLERIHVPGEDEARARALEVARAAYRDFEPQPRPRVPRGPLLAALLAVAVVAGLALTSPGQAVTDWVRDRIGHDRLRVEPPAPALRRLPAPGTLLVDSPRGAWVVRRDGSKRLLGAYHDPTWSPHALFVGAVHGNELVALTPAGRVRWALTRTAPHDPDWSPSGFRVAYIAAGWVRVVAGDGTGDRRIAPGRAVAWAPGTRHVLALAPPGGGVRVVDTDTRRLLWGRDGARFDSLSWSADGRRLAASGRGGVEVLGRDGPVLRRLRGSAARFAPAGDALAVVRAGTLRVNGRTLFKGADRLRRPVWSPDARWLVVDWPGALQWLFVRTDGAPRAIAAAGVAAEFDPGARVPSGEPVPAAWCCAR